MKTNIKINNEEDKTDRDKYDKNKENGILPIINEIKENISISNNAHNDIIINNSINKKNEKSKSNNKSSKSNVEVLVEEHREKNNDNDNNDKYTDVQN